MLNNRLASQYLKPLIPLPTGMCKRGRRLSEIACVLFDIYGTLLISAAGDVNLLPERSEATPRLEPLLRKFKIPTKPQALSAALREAVNAAHQLKRQQGIDFPEVKIDQIWMQVLKDRSKAVVRRFALEYELTVNPVYPMPHLKAMLKTCRSKRLTLGLISNAQFYTLDLFQWFLGAAPEALGFHPELIVLSYRLGHAKPSTALFQKAADVLKTLRIPSEATLFVGNDMGKDILPARNVGFRTALFAGDRRSLQLRENVPDCRNLRPDIVLTDLRQLFEFIT